ncbi:Kunitz-type trypsin inhibitor KTI1, partial [Mucuna pruriens]
MNSTILFGLFLLCAFTSYLPSTTAEGVFDTNGEPVINGGTYYVLPVIRGRGGGIERALTGNETCPLTVLQSPNELSKGLPIRFSSPFFFPYIAQGFPLIISFTFVPFCSPIPSSWTIVDGLPEGLAVKLTGYENTVSGVFTIAKSSLELNSYKLLFHASYSGSSKAIGIHIDGDGNRLLVVNDNNPFLFQLQKYTTSADTCEDIGIYIHRNGNKRLVAMENNALVIHFQKVRSSTA